MDDLTALLPQIERAAVRGWPALETAIFDGWLWRYTSGGSIRANSVATVSFTGSDAATTIVAVEEHSRLRAVDTCFTVSDVSEPSDLDARLEALGYARGDDHLTMAKAVDRDAALPAGVTITGRPSPNWMEVYLSGLSENRRAVAPRIIARLPREARFVAATGAGGVLSSGVTIGDGATASVQCMATRAEARRSGGASRVLQAIEYAAARDGRQVLYLQTSADNVAAQALYARAGFRVVGHYHTRTKPL